MRHIIVTLLMGTALVVLQLVSGMNRSQVTPGSMVKFHWNGKRQNDSNLQRLAERMNDKHAVIMERPFWFSGKRVRIQSLDDGSCLLGVK